MGPKTKKFSWKTCNFKFFQKVQKPDIRQPPEASNSNHQKKITYYVSNFCLDINLRSSTNPNLKSPSKDSQYQNWNWICTFHRHSTAKLKSLLWWWMVTVSEKKSGNKEINFLSNRLKIGSMYVFVCRKYVM